MSGTCSARAGVPMVTKPTSLPGPELTASHLSALHLREWKQLGRLEVGTANERERLLRAVLAVHGRVLPLDGERPRVLDPVQRPDQCVEVHVATPGRDEVPAAGRFTELQVRAEDGAP